MVNNKTLNENGHTEHSKYFKITFILTNSVFVVATKTTHKPSSCQHKIRPIYFPRSKMQHVQKIPELSHTHVYYLAQTQTEQRLVKPTWGTSEKECPAFSQTPPDQQVRTEKLSTWPRGTWRCSIPGGRRMDTPGCNACWRWMRPPWGHALRSILPGCPAAERKWSETEPRESRWGCSVGFLHPLWPAPSLSVRLCNLPGNQSILQELQKITCCSEKHQRHGFVWGARWTRAGGFSACFWNLATGDDDELMLNVLRCQLTY